MTIFHVLQYPVTPDQRTDIYPDWVQRQYNLWLCQLPQPSWETETLCAQLTALLLKYDPDLHQ